MSTEANKRLVQKYYEQVLNGRRVQVLDELATEDYIEHDPFPGQGTGRDGLKQRVTMLLEGLSPTFEIEDIVAEGDRVVVRWTNAGTHTGEFLGVPATRKPFRMAGIDIHRISAGRMAEHWHVVDQLAMLQQLGLIPAPETAPA